MQNKVLYQTNNGLSSIGGRWYGNGNGDQTDTCGSLQTTPRPSLTCKDKLEYMNINLHTASHNIINIHLFSSFYLRQSENILFVCNV